MESESNSARGSTLVVRADAGPDIGMGHVARCLALAQAWRRRGGHVAFIGRDGGSGVRGWVESRGITFVPLDPALPPQVEAEVVYRTLSSLGRASDGSCRWVVLDGYHFDEGYRRSLRRGGWRLLVLDDLGHLSSECADAVVNQNDHAGDSRYQLRPGARVLLGPRYAMLREEFLPWRRWARPIPERAGRALVTVGGGDPANVTPRVIEALERAEVGNLETVVVAGPANPSYRALLKRVEGVCWPVHVLQNPCNMAALMVTVDIAISAAGSTAWELAFMGVPAVLLVMANNQEQVARTMRHAGAAIVLGRGAAVVEERLGDAVRALVGDKARRAEMSRSGKRLVDGFGAERVVEAMLQYPALEEAGCQLADSVSRE